MGEFYRYQQGVVGIDFQPVIDSRDKVETIINSGSGRRLKLLLGKNLIDIRDIEHVIFHLGAEVREETFYLRVHTKGDPNYHDFLVKDRHPDMFAGEFTRFALHHFLEQGLSIKKCQGIWGSHSDNFQQFSAYNLIFPRHEAAKRTWSGRQFIALGYHKIGPKDITYEVFGNGMESITATFSK